MNIEQAISGFGTFAAIALATVLSKMSLHPKVLSRKLNGSGNAHLTNLEVRSIIKVLADWQAITTRDEALQLPELAELGSVVCRNT